MKRLCSWSLPLSSTTSMPLPLTSSQGAAPSVIAIKCKNGTVSLYKSNKALVNEFEKQVSRPPAHCISFNHPLNPATSSVQVRPWSELWRRVSLYANLPEPLIWQLVSLYVQKPFSLPSLGQMHFSSESLSAIKGQEKCYRLNSRVLHLF